MSDHATRDMVRETARVTGESAIHDLGYQRYEGTRTGAGGAWRALFRQGFRAMFGLGRTAKSKVIPVFVVVVTLVPVLGTLSAASLAQGLVPIRYGTLVGQQLIMFVLFLAAQAPETLSRDQQHRVLPLILTRDVTRTAYATARFAAIAAAIFVVALAPLLLMYIGEIGIAADPAAKFGEMGHRIFPVLAQAGLTAVSLAGIGAALAAWTPRRAYATAAIIGIFLVLSAVAAAIDDMGVSRRVASLLNPMGSLHTQAMLYFGETTRRMETNPPVSLPLHALLMLGYAGIGAALLQLRVRRVTA